MSVTCIKGSKASSDLCDIRHPCCSDLHAGNLFTDAEKLLNKQKKAIEQTSKNIFITSFQATDI